MSPQPRAVDDDSNLKELEFRLRDRRYPIASVSAECRCRIDLLETVPRTIAGDRIHEFIRVQTDDPETVETLLVDSDAVESASIVQRFDEEVVFEMVVEDGCIAPSLWDAGAILHSATAEDGAVSIVVVLPPDRDPDSVVETIRAEHPDVSVAAIRERSVADPLLTQRGFQRILEDELTERQWTSLRLAYARGYFKRPREASQRDLAAEMDISQETVSQHLRAAQEKLFAVLFEQGLVD